MCCNINFIIFFSINVSRLWCKFFYSPNHPLGHKNPELSFLASIKKIEILGWEGWCRYWMEPFSKSPKSWTPVTHGWTLHWGWKSLAWGCGWAGWRNDELIENARPSRRLIAYVVFTGARKCQPDLWKVSTDLGECQNRKWILCTCWTFFTSGSY